MVFSAGNDCFEQGLPVRVVGTMRDIDAWKRMQQEKQLVESLNYEINHCWAIFIMP